MPLTLGPVFSIDPIYSTLFCAIVQAKRQQEAELRVAALVRQTELIKASNKNAKQQIQQLQELLANREQEHR